MTGADLHGYTYNPAYWPCDASAGGNITTGVGCYGSLGTIASSYQLALQAKNQNPPDNATFTSQAFTLSQPQISIVGFDGNTLSVLAGNPNNGDASGSQGNTAEATFNWTFTPGGPLTGPVVTVPSNATSFSLNVTYKGGYSTAVNGSVVQVDLVPNFSLSPNPVLKSSTLTLKNLMQKASAATLNSVDYSLSPSGGSGTLAGSFLVVNGTAPVTAPSTVGNYTVTLTYHYTDHLGAQKTAQAALPFQVTDFTPVPALGIYTDAAHSHPVFPIGNPPTFTVTPGTQYFLFDDEPLPGGVTHPGAGFYKSSDNNQSISGSDTHIGDTTNAGPQTVDGDVLHRQLLHQGFGARGRGHRAGVQVRGGTLLLRSARRTADRLLRACPSSGPAIGIRRPGRQLHGHGEQLPRHRQLRLGLRR